jgi:hypothetical protein
MKLIATKKLYKNCVQTILITSDIKKQFITLFIDIHSLKGFFILRNHLWLNVVDKHWVHANETYYNQSCIKNLEIFVFIIIVWSYINCQLLITKVSETKIFEYFRLFGLFELPFSASKLGFIDNSWFKWRFQ